MTAPMTTQWWYRPLVGHAATRWGYRPFAEEGGAK